MGEEGEKSSNSTSVASWRDRQRETLLLLALVLVAGTLTVVLLLLLPTTTTPAPPQANEGAAPAAQLCCSMGSIDKFLTCNYLYKCSRVILKGKRCFIYKRFGSLSPIESVPLHL